MITALNRGGAAQSMMKNSKLRSTARIHCVFLVRDFHNGCLSWVDDRVRGADAENEQSRQGIFTACRAFTPGLLAGVLIAVASYRVLRGTMRLSQKA